MGDNLTRFPLPLSNTHLDPALFSALLYMSHQETLYSLLAEAFVDVVQHFTTEYIHDLVLLGGAFVSLKP